MYKTFDQKTELRFSAWRELRQKLETSINPLEDVVDFFQTFPKVKVYTDPYDDSTWPTAWQLIEENQYCQFNLVLGICYTLQLCNRFNHISPRITISIDTVTKSVYYMLFVDDYVYGFEDGIWIPENRLPKSLKNIKIYDMPPLH